MKCLPLALCVLLVSGTAMAQSEEVFESESAEDLILQEHTQERNEPDREKRPEPEKAQDSTSGAQARPEPRNIISVNGLEIEINKCSRLGEKVQCRGSMATRERTNVSIQCYSGAYLVANGAERGCLALGIAGLESWSYVAVGLEAGSRVPIGVEFSATGASVAEKIILVVSTPARRNMALEFRGLALNNP